MRYLNRRHFLSLANAQQPNPTSSIVAPEIALSEALAHHLTRRSAHPPLTGLKLYTGPWTRAGGIHLLRRTLFGPTKTDVDYFLSKTMLGCA
ncbi:MAG: hypothetical protein NZM43_06445 [Saprospiraceae bacterium]|nr:hypothetical protein [Saprospiraceae bacterium]MDW8483951.1 hypothetical protein [Saprospiraceae bacterium]